MRKQGTVEVLPRRDNPDHQRYPVSQRCRDQHQSLPLQHSGQPMIVGSLLERPTDNDYCSGNEQPTEVVLKRVRPLLHHERGDLVDAPAGTHLQQLETENCFHWILDNVVEQFLLFSGSDTNEIGVVSMGRKSRVSLLTSGILGIVVAFVLVGLIIGLTSCTTKQVERGTVGATLGAVGAEVLDRDPVTGAAVGAAIGIATADE